MRWLPATNAVCYKWTSLSGVEYLRWTATRILSFTLAHTPGSGRRPAHPQRYIGGAGMTPEVRRCRCGCGTTYRTTHPHKWYAHLSHRPKKGAHYTSAEKAMRKVLLQHPPNGAPCPRCGRPMLPGQQLDTGHVVDKVMGGAGLGLRWEHARCGRSDGARVGNRLRSGPSVRTSRAW